MKRLLTIASAFAMLLAPMSAEVTPGDILVGEMNCTACHTVPAELGARLFPRTAPRLKDGVRVRPEWIREFLADPQKAKPGTLMPDMLHGLSGGEKEEAVEALTHFIAGMQTRAAGSALVSDAAKIEAGWTLYHQVGCVQCHAPEVLPETHAKDDAALAELAALQQASVPLGEPVRKYSAAELAGFLRDPLKARPSGRMPAMRLTEDEAAAIAAYLLRGQAAEAEFTQDVAKARAGANWFVRLRCAECHGDAATGLATEAPPRQARPFAQLHPRQPAGCVGTKPAADVPKFELTDRQRTVILVMLRSQDFLNLPLTPEQQVRRTMTVLNCYACHSRDRRGGAEGLRREYLTSLGDAVPGDEGRIPPTLTGVGARLDANRLRDSLLTGAGARPFMATRMPVYGEANIAHLLPLLGAERK